VLLPELPAQRELPVSSEGSLNCGFCTRNAGWMVTRDVPGAPALPACASHLGIAVTKILERTGYSSAVIYPWGGAREIGDDGESAVKDAAEHVRRIGANSVKDPETARTMENALYRAVLALIAQGTPGAARLAATALASQQYHFERS
jgi:hypothetical protein